MLNPTEERRIQEDRRVDEREGYLREELLEAQADVHGQCGQGRKAGDRPLTAISETPPGGTASAVRMVQVFLLRSLFRVQWQVGFDPFGRPEPSFTPGARNLVDFEKSAH